MLLALYTLLHRCSLNVKLETSIAMQSQICHNSGYPAPKEVSSTSVRGTSPNSSVAVPSTRVRTVREFVPKRIFRRQASPQTHTTKSLNRIALISMPTVYGGPVKATPPQCHSSVVAPKTHARPEVARLTIWSLPISAKTEHGPPFSSAHYSPVPLHRAPCPLTGSKSSPRWL